MGETASGKDTLTKKLCEDTGMKAIVSYTTRPRRTNEGDTHIFVDDSVYEQMKDNLAAYTEINGFRYWTTIEQIYDNDIYIIDPNGLETLENLGLEDIDLCSIYINVPIDIRLERALYRGDSLEDFFSRNKSEMRQFIQMKAAGGFDYAISNLNEDKAYAVLKYIVEVETVQN
jgi:guanylate kinase